MNWKPGMHARINAQIHAVTINEHRAKGQACELVRPCTDATMELPAWTVRVDGKEFYVTARLLEPIESLGSWTELIVALGFDLRTGQRVRV